MRNNLPLAVHAVLPETFGKGIGIDLQFSYLRKHQKSDYYLGNVNVSSS